jgi:hypothetical protein
MKKRKGYLRDKPKYGTGTWLKRYFEKRTCKNNKKIIKEFEKTIEEK